MSNPIVDYELIDCGEGRKLERFGPYLLDRPAIHALWSKKSSLWKNADLFLKREGENVWIGREKIQEPWHLSFDGLKLLLKTTDFGHLGCFPDHLPLALWVQSHLRLWNQPLKLLNLFAYTGALTLIAAREKAQVCHLDASKTSVQWARDNSSLNRLDKLPIRWIVDEATSFVRRESRRSAQYDAIILDPPTFGRGTRGELFKIERDLYPLLNELKQLFSSKFSLFLLTCHTPGITATTLDQLSRDLLPKGGIIEKGDLGLQSSHGDLLPMGSFFSWSLPPHQDPR